MDKRIILIVAANPKNTRRLRLDAELKAIRDELRISDKDEQFIIKIEHAATIKNVGDALVRYKPEIVHFMGHGEGEKGLCFEGDDGKKQQPSNDAIEKIFSLCTDYVRCVYLNACYSETQANLLVKHINYVIGMNEAIPDNTATEFSGQFYRYLGLGEDVPTAFEWAQAMSGACELTDYLVPILKKKK